MYRFAVLELHRKMACVAECICGSKMIFISGWVCETQIKKKEPNRIILSEVEKKEYERCVGNESKC